MEKRWYIVHAYSNFERKVAEAIKDRARAAGLSELFEEVLVPTEDIVEVRRGRKVQAERKFFPGYVLVKMAMTDAAYHLIKNTPKVTGFLGSDNKAIPITEDEAKRILYQVKEGVERPKPMITFEVGEKVRVADGPFASFEGQVEEVDEERSGHPIQRRIEQIVGAIFSSRGLCLRVSISHRLDRVGLGIGSTGDAFHESPPLPRRAA